MNTATHTRLDMEADEFTRLGQEMLALAADWLAQESRDPVLTPLGGDELPALFDQPPPEHGEDAATLFAELREKLLRYSRRNGHPRYFAHVCASPDPAGALADL